MRDLNALLDDEDYIWMPDAFVHNTEVTILGTTYARQILNANGWSLTFENTSMTVQYAGSNNDLFDSENGVLINQPLVNVIGNNSAGLVTSREITELHQDAGLDAANPVTITENTADTSYDQTSTGITKEIRTSGSDKTITRT